MSTPQTAPRPALWAERTGTRTYTGRNSRGAEVRIGDRDEPGVFTPGELLQIALAGCVGQSADHRFVRALGETFAAVVGVSVTKDEAANRYPTLAVEVVTDLSGLPEADREKTLERAQVAVERHCTVGRTLRAGATYTVLFADEAVTS